jgi:hypothetical protein
MKRIRMDSLRIFLSKYRGDNNGDLNISGEYGPASEILESGRNSQLFLGNRSNLLLAVRKVEDPLRSENPISDQNSPKFYRGIPNLAGVQIAFPGSIIGSQVSLRRRFQRLVNQSFLEVDGSFKSIPVQPMAFQQNRFL